MLLAATAAAAAFAAAQRIDLVGRPWRRRLLRCCFLRAEGGGRRHGTVQRRKARGLPPRDGTKQKPNAWLLSPSFRSRITPISPLAICVYCSGSKLLTFAAAPGGCSVGVGLVGILHCGLLGGPASPPASSIVPPGGRWRGGHGRRRPSSSLLTSLWDYYSVKSRHSGATGRNIISGGGCVLDSAATPTAVNSVHYIGTVAVHTFTVHTLCMQQARYTVELYATTETGYLRNS